jgi:DNA-binding response OmpR family regulator
LSHLESSSSTDTIRVLHVDDELNQLEFVKKFLERADPKLYIESVSHPQEALRLLQRRPFDCIVSDYQMPGLDGLESASKIRESSDVPIIIYTGRGSEDVAVAAFSMGIDDYIRKEVDPSHYTVLAKRIMMAVEKNRAQKRLIISEGRARLGNRKHARLSPHG